MAWLLVVIYTTFRPLVLSLTRRLRLVLGLVRFGAWFASWLFLVFLSLPACCLPTRPARQHLDHTTAKSNLRFISNSAIVALKVRGHRPLSLCCGRDSNIAFVRQRYFLNPLCRAVVHGHTHPTVNR